MQCFHLEVTGFVLVACGYPRLSPEYLSHIHFSGAVVRDYGATGCVEHAEHVQVSRRVDTDSAQAFMM